jgi:dephospho-CoA kinase
LADLPWSKNVARQDQLVEPFQMIVIGIVGGIASGKSMVAKSFARLGAVIVDADRVGHQVLEEPSIKQKIRDAWGDRVFDEFGNVVRPRLAEIVFDTDSENLKKLEQITHPRISSLLKEKLDQLSRGACPAVVLDAPVMLKSGWDRFCDKLVYVDCPREIRLQRAAKRGWTEAMFDQRESLQISLREKKARATEIIINSGTVEMIDQQVNSLWIRWNLPNLQTDAGKPGVG